MPKNGQNQAGNGRGDAMKKKLLRLERELDETWDDRPWAGHGGTPLVDNSVGRTRRNQLDRYEARLRRLTNEVEEQKAKIERAESRAEWKSVPTKQSGKFLEKNPIHPLLLQLERDGKVRQWPRNPQYFFIVGLRKVALCTFNGEIHPAARFPAKDKEEWDVVKGLITGQKGGAQ